MSSEEKLHVLHAQLASRSLIEPLPDRLTPINEEMEDVESRRSSMSSRPPSTGEKSVSLMSLVDVSMQLRPSLAGWEWLV